MSRESWQATDGKIAAFGSYELDPETEILRRRGVRVHVQDMPLQVLAMMLERPGELIRRETFFDRLWPDDNSGLLDDNLNSAVRKLRIALDDSARNPRFIETVPRRGYRFVAPVKSAGAPEPTRETPATAESNPPPELSSLFVGRGRELQSIGAALDDCLSNRHNRLVMISGEAGIGKTRLAERLAGAAAGKNAAVLWARHLEERGAPPYWPWVQMLRALIDMSEHDVLREALGPGAADIAGIVPELGTKLNIEPPEPLAAAEQNRFRLFDSVAGFLQRTAQRRPLVLIFDNLHSAGRPSLLLFEYLDAALSDFPVLMAGTYRPSAISRKHPLFNTLGTLNRGTRFSRIQLRGLTTRDIAHYLRQALDRPPPPRLVEAIRRETEGNPFFVLEVVRLLIAEGKLDNHAPGTAAPLVLDIPEGIREVIGKRLNRLSDICNGVLEQAAVIGRRFGLDVLSRLNHKMDEAALFEALDEAAAAGVIVEDEQQIRGYRFNHALIRETLYDELSPLRRTRLHGRIGAALETLQQQRGDGNDSLLPKLAHHFSEAARGGQAAKAVDYSMQAAQRAESQFAYEEAAGFYRNARDIMELDTAATEMDICRLLLAEASGTGKGGRVPEAMELALRGADIARRQADTRAMIKACGIIDDMVSNIGVSDSRVLPLLEDTLNAVDQSDSAQRAYLLGALARARYCAGQPERGEQATAESLAIARQAGDAKALVSAYRARLYSRYPPESFPERIAAAEEALHLAEVLNDPELQHDIHILSSCDQLELGDLEAADRHLRHAGELGRTIRQPLYIHYQQIYRAMRAILEGRYHDGEALAHQAMETGSRIRKGSAEGMFGMQMFAIRRDQGRLGEVANVLQTLNRDRPAYAAWRPGLALIYSKLGMAREARGEFEHLARDDFAGVPRDAMWPTSLAYLSEVAVFLEDNERAARLYELLKPYDGRNLVAGACVVFLGAASYYLGLLAQQLGQADTARKHWEDALELNQRMGAKPWLARTRRRLAQLLMETGQTPELAKALHEQAASAAGELGMSGMAEAKRP